MNVKVIGEVTKKGSPTPLHPLTTGAFRYFSDGGPWRTRTADLMRVKHAL